jgi:hypothetical protein
MFNKIFSQMHSVFFVALLMISSAGLFAQNGYLPRESFEGASYTLAVHEVNFEGVQNTSKFRLPYSSVEDKKPK